MKYAQFFIILLFSIICIPSHALDVGGGQESEELIQQLRLGGRSVTGGSKGVWSVQNALEYFKGEEFSSWEWEVDILYGIGRVLNLEIFIPFFLKNQFLEFTSRGPGDLILNLQWTFFSRGPNSALVAFGPKFPTGKLLKLPPTGTGTYDVNLEFSFVHSNKWYFSTVLEMLLTTRHSSGLKPANEYDYEFILGRNISIFHGQLTLSAELFGAYVETDKLNGSIIPETGGNVLYFGPLVSFSYGSLLFDLAFQWAATQRLFGTIQPKNEYTTLVAFTVTF